MILNLKKLNKYIDSKHFKIESLQNILQMVKSGVWMASVDLKDAYYSVPINKEYQKYLKFPWKYPLKFIVMPNGYGPVMRAFTKLMKPTFSFLRSEGYLSVIYVDDCYLQGDSFTKCAENVIRTIDILGGLGFYIKIEKSEIIPEEQITFLGVIIDSLHMKITLTNEKKQKILKLCTAARLAHTLTIRELAKLIGNLVASMEAVPYGRLFYRQLEREKIKSLQQNKGNFEAKITLSDFSKKELTCCENSIMTATKILKKLPIDTTICTDASLDGWVAVCEKSETGGMWTKQEKALHINALERLGANLGLFSFFRDNKDIKHIRVMMDNNTAVAYINNMGELGPICVMIFLSTYGSGQQNDKYGFQQPTSQDLKML